MRRLRRRCHTFVTLLSLVIVLLITSSCATVAMESDFREDGSARHTVETTIEKGALEQLASIAGADISQIFTAQDEAERRAEEAGLEYERIDTDRLIGARVSKTVDDARDIGATFNQLISQATAGVGGDGAERLQAVDGAVTGTYTQDGDRASIDMMVDSDRILGVLGGLAGGDGSLPISIDQLSSFVDITYTASLPGEIVETNGGQVDDNTALWDIPLTGQTRIIAVAEGSGSGGSSLLPLIGLLVLLALLLGAAVFFFVVMQRRPLPRA